jgi:hypothetical protein
MFLIYATYTPYARGKKMLLIYATYIPYAREKKKGKKISRYK